MRRSSVLALALTLGLALSVVAGAVSVVGSTAAPAPEQTRDLEANAGATMSTEPWPGADAIMSEAGRGFPGGPSMGAGPRAGGCLWCDWLGVSATTVFFDGKWNVTGDRHAGALAGHWVQSARDGGGFRGEAVAASSIAPVGWGGAPHTTDGH